VAETDHFFLIHTCQKLGQAGCLPISIRPLVNARKIKTLDNPPTSSFVTPLFRSDVCRLSSNRIRLIWFSG